MADDFPPEVRAAEQICCIALTFSQEFDFGKKKSKKAKKAAIHELEEATAAVTLDDADIDPDAEGDELNFGKKKKKKAKEPAAGTDATHEHAHAAEDEGEAIEGKKKVQSARPNVLVAHR